MEYNTNRPDMTIPEYGRNVQRMVDYLLTLEDREQRNKEAENLVKIIGNLNPKIRETDDYHHKLWDHLHIMSDFKLDVDSPYPAPNPESLREKPEIMEYPDSARSFRHYGNILKRMIQYTDGLEDGEEKEALKETVANQMKKTYLIWNKDNVEDEVIKKEMEKLAGSKLELDELSLADKNELVRNSGQQQGKNGGNKRKFKKRGKKRFPKKQ